MNLFPGLDPIPLPAPVWLFKGLHVLTLALHFTAMQIMVGSLLAAVALNLRGCATRGPQAGVLKACAGVLGGRLPVVMTFVINLGVPPLLFAQVLYGPALYTSSILIGAWWISVIVLLTFAYWLLYRFAAGCEAGRQAWWSGLLVWIVIASVAKIYSTNMTLMIRPEVWQGMYAASAHGLRLPPHDPMLLPRWLFMLTGGLPAAGVWMIWLAGRPCLERPVRQCLARTGGGLAAGTILAQAAMGLWVWSSLAPEVRQLLAASPVYHAAGLAWFGLAAAVFVLGVWNGLKQPATAAAAWITALAGFLSVLAFVIFRDGMRDLTLLTKHFDVWNQKVETNMSVLVLFLVLFVAGLGALGWLASVMVRAKPVSGKAAA